MKNAHERFGILEYTKRMEDTTTQVRLRLDRFIGEIDQEGTAKAHLISVLGGDSDVGAIWAAVNEQNSFMLQGPTIRSLTASLGEAALCFRGSIAIAGTSPFATWLRFRRSWQRHGPDQTLKGSVPCCVMITQVSCCTALRSVLACPPCPSGPAGQRGTDPAQRARTAPRGGIKKRSS